MSVHIFDRELIQRCTSLEDWLDNAAQLVNLGAAKIIEAEEMVTELEESNTDSEAFVMRLRVQSIRFRRPYSFFAEKAHDLAL